MNALLARLLKIIELQERREYHFYAVVLFCAFVGLGRFFLELTLGRRPIVGMNVAAIHHIVFYLHCLFIYTLVLKIFVRASSWRRLIRIALTGVFLGLLPPFVDLTISGFEIKSYAYATNFPEDWRLLLYNDEINFLAGEAIVLFMLMALTSVVVYLRTRSAWRSLVAFAVAYLAVVFITEVLPTTAYLLEMQTRQSLGYAALFSGTVSQELFAGLFRSFSVPLVLTLLQLAVTMLIYLALNPRIAVNLVKRFNHAAPFGVAALVGYSVVAPLDRFAWFAAGAGAFAFVVAIVQNDYCDREEDALEGRETYVDENDVRFFNALYLLVAVSLIASAHVAGWLLVIFFAASCLYNYRFYRAKSSFPAMYKIEGVWGLTSFLLGVTVAFVNLSGLAGDVVNAENSQAMASVVRYQQLVNEQVFTTETLLFAVLAFGGWSAFSVIKDYKDVDADRAVGNQSLYVLLQRRGWDLARFHRAYCVVLAALLAVPAVWLAFFRSQGSAAVALLLVDAVFLACCLGPPCARTVERALLVANVYLLVLAVTNHVHWALPA